MINKRYYIMAPRSSGIDLEGDKKVSICGICSQCGFPLIQQEKISLRTKSFPPKYTLEFVWETSASLIRADLWKLFLRYGAENLLIKHEIISGGELNNSYLLVWLKSQIHLRDESGFAPTICKECGGIASFTSGKKHINADGLIGFPLDLPFQATSTAKIIVSKIFKENVIKEGLSNGIRWESIDVL